MSRPKLMHSVDDGIVTGDVSRTRQVCAVCGHYTMAIQVFTSSLEALQKKGIKPTDTMLVKLIDKDPYIGIGCGCYARFHRQVAHISHNMAKRRGLETPGGTQRSIQGQ
jgi:hypothetical protein